MIGKTIRTHRSVACRGFAFPQLGVLRALALDKNPCSSTAWIGLKSVCGYHEVSEQNGD